ncbi:hypothetical protein NLX83_40350 [Allokutzneria sp. A3M-2-11 16]|uniref:hypothetical protein n=1 Tax=Allokutzneria sp. A3M-2-11 16 TaxID=2962043 RepID=UPI0020B8F37F|nr:hypothetical protein [Allokutzneria sp. A3M-2-11 16]MCP3805536.1 hypothetical protein [Allokutzneria sp. A3M-2-11 16]
MAVSHVSVAVTNPEAAARAVAEIWQGSAFPFFPHAGAWIAFSSSAVATPETQIEFYPEGSELAPVDTDDDHEFQHNPLASFLTPTHIAIKTLADRATVEKVAAREGWRCRLGNRGGVFDTLDVWIEDRLLVEVLTPELQGAFDAAMNAERWTQLTNGV